MKLQLYPNPNSKVWYPRGFVKNQTNIYLLYKKNTRKLSNWWLTKKLKEYLVSPKLSFREKQTLFKLKANVVNVKSNYKSMHLNDMSCVFCELPNSVDCVEHYLQQCSYLSKHNKLKTEISFVNHKDIFGSIDEQLRFVRLWLNIEDERSKLLKNETRGL